MSVTLAILGAGGRGKIYAKEMLYIGEEKIKITAVVEPIKPRLLYAKNAYGISDDMCFENEDEFYNLGKICDAVMITSLDKQHFYSLMKCMDLGYDILVEKPITINEDELDQIAQKQRETGARIMVCHVLRYMSFFEKLKGLIEKKVIGDVVGIDHTEYIGNWHMGVSFVRGPWRNSEITSPISLQKICHDFDIISWLLDSDYEKVYASGKLNYFKVENAPEDAADKCVDCKYKKTCRYSCEKVYIEGGLREWASHDHIWENAQTCIYKIPDNDVYDHIVALFKFKNGVDVTFTMTAFHSDSARYTRIFGTDGSIIADMHNNKIAIRQFASSLNHEVSEEILQVDEKLPGHFSGDIELVRDFTNFAGDDGYIGRTMVEQSFQSHYMSFDVEKSMQTDSVIKNER
ncbi:MAG: Gfo/Idh/MocA family protein [Erysipelotrichaceae bacterium]